MHFCQAKAASASGHRPPKNSAKKLTPLHACAAREPRFVQLPCLSALNMDPTDGLIYHASINGTKVSSHLDPGASHAFMSPNAAWRCVLTLQTFNCTSAQLNDRSFVHFLYETRAMVALNDTSVAVSVFVIAMNENHEGLSLVTVARAFLDIMNLAIDWKTH